MTGKKAVKAAGGNSDKMSGRLRRQFILIAVSVLAAAMLILAGVINGAAWLHTKQEIRDTMNDIMLSEARTGGLGGMNAANGKKARQEGKRGRRESVYESRFFVVQGNAADLTHVASYTEEEALSMAREALAAGRENGFLSDCYYVIAPDNSVFFLNCESRLEHAASLALISLAVWAVCLLIAAALIALFSRRAIHPYVENAEKQKRFITDASHELKTPLSVIGANMDVLEMDVPDNEWILSTKRQVGLMRRLVNDMVFLARSDEGIETAEPASFDIAGVLRDTAEAFSAPAEQKGQRITLSIPDSLTVCGDENGITRLISILCDNAVKYAPEEDEITLSLRQDGACTVLECANTSAQPFDQEALKHMFDRFWRGDKSRTRKSGGFGIGLAIAASVAEKHKGSIAAEMNGGRLVIRVRMRIGGKV